MFTFHKNSAITNLLSKQNKDNGEFNKELPDVQNVKQETKPVETPVQEELVEEIDPHLEEKIFGAEDPNEE